MYTKTNHQSSHNISPELTLVLQEAKEFLLCYFADTLSEAETKSQLRQALNFNPLILHEGIRSIKKLLNAQLPPNTLLNLVLWSVNTPLETPNDENAEEWLKKAVQMAQFILDTH
ncbi:MAG: hypothetical protein GFH27_549293n102 [Chloroflexi bacterium AL-W]|nr:hypothetical protein [Chloroflexi bacterium AL-N1]NOK67783.1 hypothetical protein [Chloroflexi bacterium AL-N10]NOK75447.1 hypothetical protein [Chloroflexi bacterium AL-N5]NOK82235.1 hypothetical protein [Chloroflexi bacterium AL-W]NOK90080.1 hypothetical protein [Chloroflexi bacterium AL-N15]